MGRSGNLPHGASDFLVGPDDRPEDEGCTVLHVDMDAFFVSVELRNRPELRDRPVVVAGGGNRGVVTAANYPARTFGVHSAMPASQARRLCPHAVFLSPTPSAYREVSRAVMAIFGEITPLVEPLSLDEAFLDVKGALRRLRATPVDIGRLIRRRVSAEQGITCSVGVAATKFIAKLASGMAKPDGMIAVPVAKTFQFLHPLPVSALWGVGARTAEQLRRIGLETVADIAATPIPRLRRVVGAAAAEHLHALARAHDPRAVIPDREEKSIGAETTFEVDHTDHAFLCRELLRLAERTAVVIRAKGLRGRTVSIKVRYADFTTITRARTLSAATDLSREIYCTAAALLAEQVPEGAVRLIGVRLGSFVAADRASFQLAFDESDRGWREAEQAADAARNRFGSSAVRPASLLARGGESQDTS